jgi:hypothetical protein
MLILSKRRPVTPSPWFPFQNIKAMSGKKKYTANATGRYILCCLLGGLWQRGEWSHLVVNVTGKKNTKISWGIPETWINI